MGYFWLVAKTIHDILISYWGYSSFRSLQEEIITSVIEGKDTLALLPTGGGKSVCFQVPGLFFGGCTIVVSPLIALMKDQVYQLKKRGINAECLVSGMSKTAIDQALDNCIYGKTQFLYVSPERLSNELFLARLPSIKCNLLAIDEAHCISQWGYDFRPDYLKIAEVREFLPNVPVIALTATATPQVAKDIQDKLMFKEDHLLQKSFERDNLSYIIKNEHDKFHRLELLIEKTGGSGILYVQNRRRTEEYAQLLINRGINALAYHAGLPTHERSEAQDKWIRNEVQVIVATNAFGMGIDKADVRWVVHFDIPETPEAYFQEAGRAGRDEKKAYAVLLYNENDVLSLEASVRRRFPEKELIREVYQTLMNQLKIAVESGENESYPFDMKQFSKRCNLPSSKVKSAMKVLALEGLVYLPEESFAKSTVKILVGRKYFETENKEKAVFVMLLRSYSGLFDFPTQIDETELAERLEWTLSEIKSTLTNMHKKSIVQYKELRSNYELTMLKNRIKSESINFHVSSYDMLKERALKRMYGMQSIVTQEDCRSKMLLSYFGENRKAYCGKCDYCLTIKSSLGKGINFADLANTILEAIGNQQIVLQSLIDSLSKFDDASVVRVMEWLEEQKKIEIESDMVFRYRK